MNKKFAIFFIFLILVLIGEYSYLKTFRSLSKEDIILKNRVVKFGFLTDLAVSTETKVVRERSVVDIFSVFNESPELLEYFPTTFVYAPSCVLKKNPSRIDIE